MATILVTGGAGYVGSHCCLALGRAGHKVVVYDNLSNGHARFVKWGPLEEGDIRDAARLREVFAAHRPDAVLHCAALIEVGESVKHPERFHDVNVRGTAALLEAMREAGTPAFVFSSSCAVYGAPERLPMDEAHQRFWVSCQLAALQLVDAVKDAKHLQKNLGHYLDAPPSAVREAYVELRRHLLVTLHEVRELARSELPEEAWQARLRWLDEVLSLFGGRALPMMSQLAEAGKLTMDDVRELEKTIKRLNSKKGDRA